MNSWDRKEYLVAVQPHGGGDQKLVGIHNQLAEECREKFGEGPDDLLLTGYEE